MPVRGSLHSIPIYLAIFLDIGEPRHFGMFGMTILDERVHTRRAEAATECGEFGRAEVLIAEHEHRMLGQCAPDPGEGPLVERPFEINSQYLGSERVAQRPKCGSLGHGDPPIPLI